MDIKIVSQKENKLLDRKEMSFEIDHSKEVTPTRLAVRDLIAAKGCMDSKLVSVVRLKSRRGKGSCEGLAHLYKSEKTLKEIEPKYIQKRHAEKKPAALTEEPKPAEAVNAKAE